MPRALHLTIDGDTGAASIGGKIVGGLAGMKIHVQLTGDITIRHETHGQPVAGESRPGQGEAEGDSMWDVISGAMAPVSSAVAVIKKRAVSALVRAIPDDSDYAKHLPLEYRLDAKEIVDFLLEDLHAARATDDLERGHVTIELADWGIAAAEMFGVELGAAGLLAPVLAVVGLFASLGAGYAGANERIAAKEAATGFAIGAVTSTQGMSAQKIMEQFGHESFHYDQGAYDANKIAQAYRLGGLAAAYLQGRRLSANQGALFWHDLQRRRHPSEPGPLEWAGVFLRDHLQAA